MKCNPLRWLFGIIPILLLAGVAVISERERIENDLAARAQQVLEQAGLGWASAKFDGRDGILSGLASEDPEPARAAGLVGQTFGVRIVRNDAGLIDRAERYDWAASKRDGRVRLSGLAPNDKTRREILGLARGTFPSNEINDRMSLARGAPALDTWLGGVGFALKQLTLLKSGTVRLEATELTVAGEAIDAASYRAIKTALATGLPPGIRLKADRVEAPVMTPYVWTARLVDGQLDLRGAIPGEAAREELLTLVRRQAQQVKPADAMAPARGEPEGWAGAARAVLEALLRLEEGTVELRDQTASLSGVATREAIADSVRAKLKEDMPAAFRLMDRITFREPTIRQVSPYQTSIAFENGTLTLTGYVPNEAARAALAGLAQARLSGVRIVDRLELGTGAGPGWQRCLDVGLAMLARIGNGRMALSDRRLRVEGVTEAEVLARALPAEAQAAATRECEPDVQIALKARPEPKLRWSARSGAEGDVVLEGQVPGAEVRDDLLATAARLFTGRSIVNRMEVVGEPSERWARTARVGLAQLARLRLGRAEIVEQSLRIEGEARDVADHTAIRDALGREMPEGYAARDMIAVRSDAAIAAEALARRTAEENARKRAAEETEAAAKQRAQAEASRQSAAAEMRRHAEEEARRRAEEEARRASEAAAARQRAEAEERARAEADARRRDEDAAARRRVEEAARLAREAEVRKAEQERAAKDAAAEACQKSLRAVSSEGVILFSRASAELDRRSLPTLRRLAGAAQACPDVTIEIEGHTDAEGIDERNQPLSERRAQAVADYLAERGVPIERMKAVGYGASRPVAPNDTRENMARNRRIEFTVKAN